MAAHAVTKVVNRCEEAKEGKRLDLSSCELTQVPDAIFLLMRNTALESCDLSNNVLSRIPSKLAIKFTHITELSVCHNILTALPEEMKEITGLKSLNISHNHFLSLPRVVYKLPSLAILNAKKNSIAEVDVGKLGEMTTLDEVNLQLNPIPDTISQQLKKIKVFSVLLGEPDQADLEDVDD